MILGLVLLIGLWKTIFSFLGLIGVLKKNKDFIYYVRVLESFLIFKHTIGQVIAVVFSVACILLNLFFNSGSNSNPENITSINFLKNEFFYIFVPISSLLDVKFKIKIF